MNPFKKIARVVTAPVRAVKNTARLLTIRNEAEDVLELAQEAEANPRLYRDQGWWTRLLTQAGELLAVLPIAPEGRVKLQDLLLKVAMVLGAIGGIGGVLAEQGVINLLPHKYAAIVGGIFGAAGTIAAYLLKSPLAQQQAPASAEK
jgi:hypothetical protein